MKLVFFGAGIFDTTAGKIFSIPIPFFALTSIISFASISNNSVISFLISSIFAEGKSILFITGINLSPRFFARVVCAILWASIPCVASITNIAPSQADNYLETS